jgi:hypothetical protein
MRREKEKSQVENEVVRLFEAAKALITYIDQEPVFDKVGDMGCCGVDMHQSEVFYNLIAEARKAVREFEDKIKEPG